VAYVLALLSAAFYGAADFMGGLAARGAATVAIVILTQFAGMVLLALLLPVLPDAAPSTRDLLWGIAAGVFGSVGVALLYRALAIGTMAIIAPTTAVCAMVIPVVVGVLLGDRPGLRALAGIVLANAAIVLVSQQRSAAATCAEEAESAEEISRRERRGQRSARTMSQRISALCELSVRSSLRSRLSPSPRSLPPGLDLALLSGVAIGFFFLTLAQTAQTAGLWPLLAARGVSLVLFGAIAFRRTSFRMSRRVLAIAVVGGMLDMLANAFYLVAVRQGPLAAVVTLSSLYPAGTVVLARMVLRERLNALQALGIAAALVAVILIVSE
jgi:uncharacterized membrane protein